jgi:hypothetical protein
MKLTLENVKAACRAAYEAGTLIAQHPHLEYGYERTDNGEDCHCAIGCALDRETLDYINENNWHESILLALSLYGVVEVDENEFPALSAIQQEHDNWLRALRGDVEGYIPENAIAIAYRDDFLQLIKE